MLNDTVNTAPLITNDAVVLGLLAIILGLVFYTSTSQYRVFKKFFTPMFQHY
jgi:ABC-type thiamin/hydroxymethylpyrimidine transport system permease subunit